MNLTDRGYDLLTHRPFWVHSLAVWGTLATIALVFAKAQFFVGGVTALSAIRIYALIRKCHSPFWDIIIIISYIAMSAFLVLYLFDIQAHYSMIAIFGILIGTDLRLEHRER